MSRDCNQRVNVNTVVHYGIAVEFPGTRTRLVIRCNNCFVVVARRTEGTVVVCRTTKGHQSFVNVPGGTWISYKRSRETHGDALARL